MYISGIKADNVRTSAEGPEFQLGTLGFVNGSEGPKAYRYVTSAGGVTGAGYVVDIDSSSNEAALITTTTSAPGTGAGKAIGVGVAAIAAGGFGWVQVYGRCLVRTLALAAAYTILNSTATAGALDDDATVGAEVIDGLVLDVATGGAPASTAGFANWPKVGRTL